MTSVLPSIEVVSSNELDGVLDRIREARIDRVAIVGLGALGSLPRQELPEVFRRFSTIVQLRDVDRRPFARLTELSHLVVLAVVNVPLGDEGAKAIAQLSGLTSLDLWGNGMGAEGAKAIAQLSGLTSLNLGYNSIGAEGAKAIAQLSGLTSLDLGSNSIGVAGVKAIAQLSGLISLELWGNSIGDEGAKAIAQLSGLTSLDLGRNGIGDEGAKAIAQLSGLTSLNLGSNSIGGDGAKAVAQLSGLTSLNLGSNSIGGDGAKAVAQLTGLTSLELRGNGIGAEGAKVIAQLTGLASVDLSSNDIGDEGAKAVAQLTGLTSLELWDNGIGDEGAKAIAQLTGLTSLDLGSNDIGDEGAKAIAQLTGLTSVNLSSNGIGAEGANAIAQLIGLTSLNLNSNWIVAGGATAIAQLTGLTSLELWSTGIGDEGAKAIAQLTGLTSVNLSSNGIGAEGAKAIAQLTGLTSLDLWSNGIGAEGAKAIAQLTGLTSLDLSSNGIGADGAKAIAQLTGLTSLHLSANGIGAEGAKAIAQLTGLTSLDLSRNAIGAEGAKAIAQLTGLTSLDLSRNDVGDKGATAIGQLTGLTSLNLNTSGIGDQGAKAVAQLSGLFSLDMGGNRLSNAGARMFTALTRLRRIEVRGTLIEDFAPFATFMDLEFLDARETNARSLAPLRNQIRRGLKVSDRYASDGVLVGDCPLVHPPLEVVAQGREAILNYFDELDAQGTAQLFEAKVLIVGEGSAGKTSLLRRLYQIGQELPAADETTRGIDIHEHHFPMRDGREFRLNVWDFGGQQIYHATHQFFLTRSSLYVLVDDTRKDAKSVHDEGFKYWFEVVESLSDGSPLLIFQNEKGGRSKAIDVGGIKGRFPNMKDVYAGDLSRPGAVEGLRAAIEYQVQSLPNVGQPVPARWVDIRKAIEERSREVPFISQGEYFEIYEKYLPFDRDKALHLSRFLHELGVFLHFQADRQLRRTVILQNQWATDAVFRVLDDEAVKKAQGRFSMADCSRIWAKGHDADMHAELLALMEKFELCYPLPDAEPERWLAPQLLSPSPPPDLDESKQAGNLVLHYRYEFLPKGLVSRSMVRLHRLVPRPEQAWASGVLFERNGSSLLLRTEPSGTEITLRARGTEAKELMIVVASDLDALNESFQGLRRKVEKWVPCCCDRCEASPEPELFAEGRLRKRKEDGKLEVECPTSYADVSVLKLLDGIDLEKLPRRSRSSAQGVSTLRNVKIFLASSAEMKSDSDAFDLYIRQQNDAQDDTGLNFEVVRWEHFLDAMSETRLQDEYNRAVRGCDVFVSLFGSKAGRYTVEEFKAAHEAFKAKKRPLIYTYFRETQVSATGSDRAGLQSLWALLDYLKDIGHYPTHYENAEHLKRHFKDQLQELARQGKL